MTNAELITELTYHANIEKRKLLSDAADALEAAEQRIADLEKALAACRARGGEQLPKEGEWSATSAEVDGSRFTGERCSICGWWKSMGIYNYCPNCGARMKGEHDAIH